ncbi:hypothetical protein [Bacillus sp. BHET2]|nr:hypothetical protein [Bacillus sp. BHET2]
MSQSDVTKEGILAQNDAINRTEAFSYLEREQIDDVLILSFPNL